MENNIAKQYNPNNPYTSHYEKGKTEIKVEIPGQEFPTINLQNSSQKSARDSDNTVTTPTKIKITDNVGTTRGEIEDRKTMYNCEQHKVIKQDKVEGKVSVIEGAEEDPTIGRN